MEGTATCPLAFAPSRSLLRGAAEAGARALRMRTARHRPPKIRRPSRRRRGRCSCCRSRRAAASPGCGGRRSLSRSPRRWGCHRRQRRGRRHRGGRRCRIPVHPPAEGRNEETLSPPLPLPPTAMTPPPPPPPVAAPAAATRAPSVHRTILMLGGRPGVPAWAAAMALGASPSVTVTTALGGAGGAAAAAVQKQGPLTGPPAAPQRHTTPPIPPGTPPSHPHGRTALSAAQPCPVSPNTPPPPTCTDGPLLPSARPALPPKTL